MATVTIKAPLQPLVLRIHALYQDNVANDAVHMAIQLIAEAIDDINERLADYVI